VNVVKAYEGVEAYQHSFSTPAPDAREWLASLHSQSGLIPRSLGCPTRSPVTKLTELSWFRHQTTRLNFTELFKSPNL